MGDHDDFFKFPTGKMGKGEWCDECGRYNNRYMVVDGVVVRDGQILMIKRGIEPSKGWWALPAGYLDWNETTEEAVLRELKEETGVEGKVVELLGVYSSPERDPDDRQNVSVAYVIEPLSEIGEGEEVEEIRWFDLDELPEKIAFDHRKMINDYVDHLESRNLNHE